MPFKERESHPISNKDIVSFALDDPDYDIDKPLLINAADPTQHYTHRTATLTVRRLIAGLHASGLKPNDVVLLHSFNTPLYPLLILAIIGAGGIHVGTNPSYTTAELSHALRLSHAKFVLSEPELLPNITDAIRETAANTKLFVLDTLPSQSVPSGHISWRALLNHGETPWLRFDDATKSRDTVAQLYYTSGTTGLPKCAMVTHRNIVSQHQLFFEASPRPYLFKLALTMPFFHMGIAPYIIVSGFREGREAYVMRRFELEPYLRLHTRYGLTEVFMVPPMVNAVVMSGLADETSPNYKAECSLRSVRNGTSGAAPLSGDLQSRFAGLLGEGGTFSQVWGMTETTSIALEVPWGIARGCSAGKPELQSAWGTVGIPIRGISMKLVDENGRDVTDSGKGELCVKGPTVVKGYFENEKATKESWDEEGYFKTGDVVETRVHRDPETGDDHALCYVVERLKELIKVRGFQVAPAELEGALTEHADIVDAAVIGLATKGQDGTELPKAYLVRRPGSKITEQDVMAHMKGRLARYKQLEGGVEFVDSIPKLPSGKILKRVLREDAKRKAQQDVGVSKL
ncbi:hypothetical protein OHC33_001587 [Knufia fluminis]|uniref:Uncharacterized protein n=1 Tax=Knufia fluminis TaxID=191047 RepID=A0AAN8IAV4_9EURO|nr:hypothetical protein OHC33_001587 [Knufia fluminis]